MSLVFNEVTTLTPAAPAATCRGESFTIKPFGVRKLQKALPHIAVIGTLLQVLDSDTEDNVTAMLGLVAHGGDALLELLGLAVDRPLDWFDDADAFEVAALALVVAQVNVDFFASARGKLDPLKKQAAALMAQIKGA